MGVGYTTIMYDAEEIETSLADIGACRYDGVEIGVGKLRANGGDNVRQWLEETSLNCYCVMSEWLESEQAVQRMVEDMSMIAGLGAENVGFLPPQRGRYDEATVEGWLTRVTDAALDAGLCPLVHHHGATAVEQPGEIQHYLDAVEGLELLFDTAHYYPYSEDFPGGDLTAGIERFVDDIGYVHLKDVDPVKEFEANRDALSNADFHLDNVINYFRSFSDLGAGVLDFETIYEALVDAGYEGHYTIEIENQTEKPLIHAKENYDYWQAVSD